MFFLKYVSDHLKTTEIFRNHWVPTETQQMPNNYLLDN